MAGRGWVCRWETLCPTRERSMLYVVGAAGGGTGGSQETNFSEDWAVAPPTPTKMRAPSARDLKGRQGRRRKRREGLLSCWLAIARRSIKKEGGGEAGMQMTTRLTPPALPRMCVRGRGKRRKGEIDSTPYLQLNPYLLRRPAFLPSAFEVGMGHEHS